MIVLLLHLLCKTSLGDTLEIFINLEIPADQMGSPPA
jgi:hypothetical protein